MTTYIYAKMNRHAHTDTHVHTVRDRGVDYNQIYKVDLPINLIQLSFLLVIILDIILLEKKNRY